MPIINTQIKGSGAAPSGKYQLFDTVKDDNNTNIGVVVGFHKDANDVEYAVVGLFATYRDYGKKYLSDNSSVITTYPVYTLLGGFVAKETATYNCDKTLEYAAANNLTSDAVTSARSNTFVIDGVTYAGQIPNVRELTFFLDNADKINAVDTTGTLDISNSLLYIPSSTQQHPTDKYIYMTNRSGISATSKTYTGFTICPVLEIPNA